MDISRNYNLRTNNKSKNDPPKIDEPKEPEKPKTDEKDKTPPPPSKTSEGLKDVNVLDYLLADGESQPPKTRTAPAPELPPPPTAPQTEGNDSVAPTGPVDGPKEIGLTNDVPKMTEAQAIEQGYTIIRTAEDLKKINDNLSGKYIIMNDIDLSGVDWDPIGSDEKPFRGILNGNGYSISNLKINADNGSETSNVGFIGVATNATISNIILENAEVITPPGYNKGSVGLLIGRGENINIDNVSVSGSASGHQKVGGLIGTLSTAFPAQNSSIKNVKVDADVNSSYYAGGLVGYIDTFDNGCNVVIENSSVAGNISSDKKCAGGFIGEAGSTIVTINNSSCSADIAGVDGAQRIGGFIGCANGTKIAICNSPFTGNISAQGEFQGKNYGYYMNDAHVSIFELKAGLPVNDILKLDGVENLKPIYNEALGKYQYEVAVSTLTGLDKVVAMIQQNPNLADLITFNVNFDFEAMDGEYSSSVYAQYGVVQHQYEDEEGNITNDVYIDNEIDTETTFHSPDPPMCDGEMIELPPGEAYRETMVKGLYIDKHGNYFVDTAYGMVPTTLAFFYNQQKTNVKTRLEEDEVEYRNQITDMVKSYQTDMRSMLKNFFNYDGKSNTIIGEPEYNYLNDKRQSGGQLSDLENLQVNIYDLDMKIIDMVNKVTHNEGCGMGGDASFLDETTAQPMYDEDGRMRFTTLGGTELRQQVDADNNPILGEDGSPKYENLDGEPWEEGETVFNVRGYPKTDEQGRMMYADEAGASVFKTENEDGSFTYTNEDGSAYEGETDALKQQLEEYNISEEFANLEKEMQKLLDEYKQKYPEK